jgi:hydroxymethylpyrimidine/phosphomethylpyrimidine kinase
LIIAGSDSSGGAGLQADIKTACAFGVYAMTAVTAITVQDTTGVHAIHPVSAATVREQIACCLSDLGADAIKIGMLGSAETVEAVADVLERAARSIPLVLDPVLASTGGTPLLAEDAVAVLKERLFPRATLLTPNIPETAALACTPVHDADTMRTAGGELRALGASAALVKGGHAEGTMIEDVLVWNEGARVFSSPRIESGHTHGTGCTLATAIACGLAQQLPLIDSIERARAFVQEGIRTAPDFGHGNRPLNHLHMLR